MSASEFKKIFNHRLEAYKKACDYDDLFKASHHIYDLIVNCLRNGGKILICGNGGSAADSQHIAAEFVVKLKKFRKPLSAIALTCDNSIITAVANDFSYDKIFERQIEGIGSEDDVLIGLSTSGDSINVVNGLLCAKRMNIKTIAVTGNPDSKIAGISDYKLVFNTANTQIVQEMYIIFWHIICERIEESYEKGSFS